jgi:hypothetical protein
MPMSETRTWSRVLGGGEEARSSSATVAEARGDGGGDGSVVSKLGFRFFEGGSEFQRHLWP